MNFVNVLIDCSYEKDGYVGDHCITGSVDLAGDLVSQCNDLISEWADRKLRIWGQRYKVTKVHFAHYEYNGRFIEIEGMKGYKY